MLVFFLSRSISRLFTEQQININLHGHYKSESLLLTSASVQFHNTKWFIWVLQCSEVSPKRLSAPTDVCVLKAIKCYNEPFPKHQ